MNRRKSDIKFTDILLNIVLAIGASVLFLYASSKGLPLIAILCISFAVLMSTISIISKKINRIDKEIGELKDSLKANNTSPDNTAGKK